MRIKAYNQAIQKIDLQQAIKETIRQNESVITNLQATQFSLGQTSKGGDLPEYSKRSVEDYGKPPGPWKLKDTGAFYQGLHIAEINKGGWKTISSDGKTYEIIAKAAKRWGTTDEIAESYIFGLNKNSRADTAEHGDLVTDHIRPTLKKVLSKQTGLKL